MIVKWLGFAYEGSSFRKVPKKLAGIYVADKIKRYYLAFDFGEQKELLRLIGGGEQTGAGWNKF